MLYNVVRWLSGNTRPGYGGTFMSLKPKKQRYEFTNNV